MPIRPVSTESRESVIAPRTVFGLGLASVSGCVPAPGAGKLQRALAWQGVEMDMDEVECVMANLIFRNFVKGYIAHKSLVVVISKLSPFPPLAAAT